MDTKKENIKTQLSEYLSKIFVGQKNTPQVRHNIKSEIKSWFLDNHPDLVDQIDQYFTELEIE